MGIHEMVVDDLLAQGIDPDDLGDWPDPPPAEPREVVAAYDSALAEGIRVEWQAMHRFRREARRPESGRWALRARERRAARRAADRHRQALLALLKVRREVREAIR